MVKKIFFLSLFTLMASAQIVVEKVRQEPIGHIYHTSAEVIEPGSVRYEVAVPVDAVIERYFVKEGERVVKNQKIAIARSKTVANWSSRYLAKKKELASWQKRYDQAHKLYKERLLTLQRFESIRTKLAEIKSEIAELESKLAIIGLTHITKPISQFTLHAFSNGRIDEILVSSKSSVAANTPIVSIVRTQGVSLLVYLPIDIALSLHRPKALFTLAKATYPVEFIHVMPKVDKETMQARLLFSLPKSAKVLVGAYGDCSLQLAPFSKKIFVRRSALTMLLGSWIVFVQENEEYEPRAVDIEDFWGEWAIVRGLKPGEKYVSKGVYILKSRLLKKMIGEEE